jgi:hypothetical protein
MSGNIKLASGGPLAKPRCPETASMTDFVTDRCQTRNRLASLRDGIDAAPVRLYSSTPALPAGSREVQRHGSLPETDEAAVRAINKLRPENSTKILTADDVYLHYMEAGNSNFIDDRWMFLGPKTLKNTAAAGNRGFAFMNSHRTGGLSSPSELPFGRTFAGVYEHFKTDNGDGTEGEFRRSVLGVYMLRGEFPNGSGGPSTDAIHNGIDSGTIFDVSLGYSADAYHQYICDVCGMDMDEVEFDSKGDPVRCRHIPGTHYRMTEEEIQAQKDRGIPKGFATYTLENATPGEVSAVYNGAVPGAGFRKAVTFAKAGKFSDRDLAEVLGAYGKLAGPTSFRPRHVHTGEGDDLRRLAEVLVQSRIIPGLSLDSRVPDPEPEPKGDPVPTETKETQQQAPVQTETERRLNARIEQLEADNRKAQELAEKERADSKRREEQLVVNKTRKAAHAFAVQVCGGNPLDKDSKVSAENFGRIERLHFALGRIDALSPVVEQDKDGNESVYEMTEDFEAILSALPSNHAFGSKLMTSGPRINLPSNLTALSNLDGGAGHSDAEAAADGKARAEKLAARINGSR